MKSLTRLMLASWAVLFSLDGVAATSLSAVWANDGTDKVWQHELRATAHRNVLNHVWDGKNIHQFGAKNEVVSVALVLESQSGVSNVGVAVSALTGPGGAQIATTTAAKGDGVLNYVNRPIEVFVAKYLQIKGINSSNLGYIAYYDERHVPSMMRRPISTSDPKVGVGVWTDRPGADKFVPDALVPIEINGAFGIQASSSQIVWIDIYVPKSAAAGAYSGTVTITEGGATTWSLPLQLNVLGFSLPDSPAAKTMLAVSRPDIIRRYTTGSVSSASIDAIIDNHYKLLHRHKLSGFDGYDGETATTPPPGIQAKLTGAFFSAANGYDGPGVNTSNDIFPIGAYGVWQSWGGTTAADIQKMLDGHEQWFRANAPSVERFWYVIDEPAKSQLAQANQWIAAKNDPNYTGPGKSVPSMITYPIKYRTDLPNLDWFFSNSSVGDTPVWDAAITAHLAQGPIKKFSWYNGSRTALGSDTLEDDGASPRMVLWAMMKRHMSRYFIWAINYYNDYQSSSGDTDVWGQAKTFGVDASADPVFGRIGYNRTNGDGVWVYPGKDVKFPNRNLGVNGPIASIRLKLLRRSVQDADYIALARAANQPATDQIVSAMVPKVMWETGVQTEADPSYVWQDISWPSNGDAWETARTQLAGIIQGSKAAVSVPTTVSVH